MRRYTAFLVMMFLLPAIAWGLGADHPPSAVSNSTWPKGLAELVNADSRVHGFFVNEADVFFLKGNTDALNTFLAKLAQLPNTEVKLVIHAGTLSVQSPWDKAPRDLKADWEIYAAPYEETGERPKSGKFATHVDIWLSESIQLSDLKVPQNAEVASGGEIEHFVKAHQQNEDK